MKDYILDSELLSEKTKTAYTILSDMLPILNDIEETSREAFDEINSHDELGYVDYTSIKSNMDYIEEYRDKYKEFGAIGDSGSIYNYKCKDMTGVCYNGFIGEYQSEVDDKFYYAQENTLKKLRDSKLQDIYVENNIGIISPAMAMGSKTATSIYKDKLNIFDLLGYGRVSIAMQKEYEGMKAKIDEYNASLPKYSLEHTSKHLSDYIIEALYGPVAAETMDKLIFDAEIDKQKIHNVDDYINKMVTSADFDFETNDEKILTTAGYFVPVYGEYQILNEIIAGKNPISGVHYSIKDRLDMVAALGVGCAIGKACKGIITEIVSNKAVIAEFTGEAVAKLRIAIKDSTEAIQNVITKVYSRNNGIVEAEFAGVGKGIYIESQVLKDADQICKERYAKWIEGKLAEGAAEAERVVNGKGNPYPKVEVEGHGEVPFPDGPFEPNNSTTLRPQFTDSYKKQFKEWWTGQGKPWPEGEVNIHHIKPLSKGGDNSFENLVPLVQPEEHQPFTNWWRSYPPNK
ncbi:MAG: HNH endonuclease [Solirubrobacterales bacterium]